MTAWCISWRLQTLGFHMEGLKIGSWRTGVCARVLRRTRAQMDRRTTAPKVSCSAAVWQRGRFRRQWEQDGVRGLQPGPQDGGQLTSGDHILDPDGGGDEWGVTEGDEGPSSRYDGATESARPLGRRAPSSLGGGEAQSHRGGPLTPGW